MNYPKAILPRKNYKVIEDGSLKLSRKYYLIRRSSLPRKDMTESMSEIKMDCFLDALNPTDFFESSWNALGIFLKRHLGFSVPVRCSTSWEKGDPIPEVSEIKFNKHNKADYFPLYLPFHSVYEIPFPYIKPPKKGSDGTFPREWKTGKLTVVHKPLNTNYWHFQFYVTDELGNQITRNNATYKRETLKENSLLKALLSENLSTRCRFYNRLASNIYIDA